MPFPLWIMCGVAVDYEPSDREYEYKWHARESVEDGAKAEYWFCIFMVLVLKAFLSFFV
ncbi:hypothetical protein H710_00347 [Bartonella bacilliformis Ver097]|uniref:Uncharacterized protein n=1 Tax=Bartonella bacilliformis Ver097 TaxID=1293911 RepID=A0A072R5Z8_BARBA|nr:hypothetical protein H710_00347 [Bartonella bacilliformis Ver097]